MSAKGAKVAEARVVGAQSDAHTSGITGVIRDNSFFFIMKINFNRLNHVQLCIPPGDESRAREFYGGFLGLTEIEKPEVLKKNGGLWYEIADVQLHIGAEEGQSPSKRHPAFEVENLAEIRAHFERHGVRVKDEPTIPGARRLSFFDPFGNRIELMEMTEAR
ncbi:MAG: VOC family protein [Pyrinomonadaceae bacterium]